MTSLIHTMWNLFPIWWLQSKPISDFHFHWLTPQRRCIRIGRRCLLLASTWSTLYCWGLVCVSNTSELSMFTWLWPLFFILFCRVMIQKINYYQMVSPRRDCKVVRLVLVTLISLSMSDRKTSLIFYQCPHIFLTCNSNLGGLTIFILIEEALRLYLY